MTSTQMSDHEFVMTDFYAADCPHCQSFDPTWKAASDSTQAHNTDAAWQQKECFGHGWAPGADSDFCKELKIERFPTVKLLHYTPDGKLDKFWDYEGDRTVADLNKFATVKIDEFNGTGPLERGFDSSIKDFDLLLRHNTRRQCLSEFL